MPNILVETGYLSNLKDETLLRGLAGQYLAAESIYDGLKKFKTEYESNFSEY
jgi:N-acetylmuramoyl-L-alanine amidase